MNHMNGCRNELADAFEAILRDKKAATETHAGLLLNRAYRANEPNSYTSEDKERFFRQVAALPCSTVYRAALERWKSATEGNDVFSCFTAQIDGRLFLGLGSASVFETGVGLHPVYGAPFIPGSSLKGLARAFAGATELDEKAREILFGRVVNGEPEDSGYLIFHDAWWDWDPESPLLPPVVQEVITPHHSGYFKSEGDTEASDFDDPVVTPHLAARGSFLFAVEGAGGWAQLGARVLRGALGEMGAGARTRSGYGHFHHFHLK